VNALEQLRFDNTFVRDLPADPETTNARRQVLGACYSRVQPTPVARPRTIACSREVAEMLGLTLEDCRSEMFAEVFGGNRLLPGMDPYAACYGGHQFGTWAGQLGDGRAITLGEAIGAQGQRLELQLKGAGPTPYSRTADGRAVMRSSVREFLCSEAMHHLGVPTTRALCLVETGDIVVRDMFYDGHPQGEPGAVICRVAPSFLRFGNYEIFASRRDTETLRRLADYTLRMHFPELGQPGVDTYLRWFEEVCRRTAVMITHWMRVGFVHGVMNTDNMSVLGLTIDYGPYGWLEPYDPHWTPNTTDAEGRRYRYANQPGIAVWNLARFASSLLPLTGGAGELESILRASAADLERQYRQMLYRKIGLAPLDDDDTLAEDLLSVLQLVETDMTIFYRSLAGLEASEGVLQQDDARLIAPLSDAYYSPEEIGDEARGRMAAWLRRYLDRLLQQRIPDAERRAGMNAVNPKYVLRNYMAQLAIDRAEKGDGSLVLEMLDVLRRPYDEQPGKEEFAEKRPEWARHRPGCSMLSCSS